MERRTLGEILRTIVLTTPFVGAVACGSNGGGGGNCTPQPYTTMINSTALTDGGGLARLPDGGTSDAGCFAACATLDLYVAGCSTVPLSDGGTDFECQTLALCLGRRPADLRAVRTVRRGSAVGCLFAEAARLEAASVHAFRVLASELRAHKAPEHLCKAARRAAADEARHARTMRSLAHRHGAAPRWPEVSRPRPRTLAAVAVENAVEGCAREAYGAAVALWQAGHAQDTAVARALADIAEDEVRHAELAWELHAWFLPRLRDEERDEVRAAREAALAELATEARRDVPEEVVSLAGMPPAAIAQRLVQRLTAALA